MSGVDDARLKDCIVAASALVWDVPSRVVYRGGSSPFFGIGILRYQISLVSVFSVSILGV
jgi:hypothetical protein